MWGFHLAYTDALLTSSAWGVSLIWFLIPSAWVNRLSSLPAWFNAPVASHVLFPLDLSRTVVVNVWALSGPFSPSHWLICVLFSVTNVQIECSDRMFNRMFRFMFYAPQLWGMFSPAAISRVMRSSLPLALSPMSLTKMWSFKCSVGILPLHRRSTRSRSLDGATVVGKPPLFLRTQVLRNVASLSLASFDCLFAVV